MSLACAIVLAAGCDNTPATDGGVDAGDVDAGCPEIPGLPSGTRPDPGDVNCPDDSNVPSPEEQMGTCCWRNDNSSQSDAPEMRLTFIDIVGPLGSPLASRIVRTVLNQSIQEERFNWLVRFEGADSGGAVNILTGFGRRGDDGLYRFSDGAETQPDNPDQWCPVEIPGTIAGEVVSSGPIPGSVTVPVFDESGDNLQIELTLRNIEITQATMGENRNCIGWQLPAPLVYNPEGTLAGYVEVEPARTQRIISGSIDTTVCAALAGSLDPNYCEDDTQDAWAVQPDSLCDANGCMANQPCMADVCDPASTCNAWRFVANFAAAGVDIENGRCGG